MRSFPGCADETDPFANLFHHRVPPQVQILPGIDFLGIVQ